jgi:rRNA maturation endonuclease Nob1
MPGKTAKPKSYPKKCQQCFIEFDARAKNKRSCPRCGGNLVARKAK